MQDAGPIRIALDLAEGTVCAAEIRSSRPTALARLFEGRAALEAPALARRLFTLCARAHAAAAAAALRQAQGQRAEAETLRREAIGVLAERVFETLRAPPRKISRPSLKPSPRSASPTRTRRRTRRSAGRCGRATVPPPSRSPRPTR